MAQAPTLETPRLRIVPFGEDHLTERYVGWLNDPAVVRYSEQRFRKHTLESCRAYWRSFEETPNFFWAVVAHDAGLGHVGNLNAFIDPRHMVADVGILLGERTVWGQGYGTEAFKAVCDFLLGMGGFRKVTAGTLAVNMGMLAIMRHLGMTEDGHRVRQCLFEGQAVDVVHAALFRNENV
jgi:ribosomal-protein-alanine N-acetyltransferase